MCDVSVSRCGFRLFLHIDEAQFRGCLFLAEAAVSESFVEFHVADADIAGEQLIARFRA